MRAWVEAQWPGVAWALEYHTLILFSKGTIMKYRFILFSPWLLKSPVAGVDGLELRINRLGLRFLFVGGGLGSRAYK